MRKMLGLFGSLVVVACSGSTALQPASAGASGGGALNGAGGASDRAGSGSEEGGVGNGGAANGGAPNGGLGEGGAVTSGGSGGAGAACGPGSPVPSVYAATWDRFGYPPYAIDGCTLVYVASGDQALRLRDLASGDERQLEPGASHPRRPAISGNVIAWELDGSAGSASSAVRVALADGSQAPQLFDHAGEPRVSADAAVFTQFLGPNPNDDTDVALLDIVTGKITSVATGAGQQRFADVSPTHVAVTDFSEDPKGYFDEAGSIADIVLIDRMTLARTVRSAPGKQAFPLLGSDGALVYLEWGAVHPEPKFSQYMLKSGLVGRPVAEDFEVKRGSPVVTNTPYVRPSLRGLSLDFVDAAAGTSKLYRASLATREAPVLAPLAGTSELLGTASAETLTVVANFAANQELALTLVQH